MAFVYIGVGIIVGVLISLIISRVLCVGELHIVDIPDATEPYLCSELYKSVQSFRNKKYVAFRVKNKHSQK